MPLAQKVGFSAGRPMKRSPRFVPQGEVEQLRFSRIPWSTFLNPFSEIGNPGQFFGGQSRSTSSRRKRVT
jgi:hypothetical protein